MRKNAENLPEVVAPATGAQVIVNDDDTLMDVEAVCAFFGGVHSATVYRGIKAGRFPRPFKIGRLNRWDRSKCVAALNAMRQAREDTDTTART